MEIKHISLNMIDGNQRKIHGHEEVYLDHGPRVKLEDLHLYAFGSKAHEFGYINWEGPLWVASETTKYSSDDDPEFTKYKGEYQLALSSIIEILIVYNEEFEEE